MTSLESEVTSAIPITDDGRAVIERSLDVEIRSEIDDIDEYFEVDRCCQWILQGGHKTVALQLPDEFLCHSVHLVEKLKGRCPGVVICVLADVSFSSCCVDDISAEHCDADALIHFGHACLSPCYKYPVLYIFGRDPIDVDDFYSKYSEKFGLDKVIVFYGVEYSYCVDDLKNRLKDSNVVFTTLALDNQKAFCCSRLLPAEDSDLTNCKIIYIGRRQTTLSNLAITLNQCELYSYDPDGKELRLENKNVNRTLMRRFNMVEKTKDAKIVGILTGASGHKDYHKLIRRLKLVLKTAGKKYYSFVVGKLNIPKLANFMEIDVYVMVACHENALLESKEFYRPVVTPLEVELACNPDREWSQSFSTDFSQLLPGGSFYCPMPDKVEMTGDVSLVTGQIRTLGTDDHDVVDDGSGRMVKRSDNTTVATVSAGDFLSSRSWTGLEQKLGQTLVSKAVEGQTGIARVYKNPDSSN